MTDPFFGRLGRAIMKSASTFKQEFVTSSTEADAEFGTPEGRALRYDLLWSFYENNAYDRVHRWAAMHKAAYAMYRYTRSLYNPSYRLGNFWSTHLMGGPLDPEAGDGTTITTALPIITDHSNVREAISAIWGWSNWSQKKDLWTLLGSILGDSFIQVNDDVARGKVYLEVLHPSDIFSMEVDPFGNIKEYIMSYPIEDPENPKKIVEYREDCFKDGDLTVFRTYRDNRPFAYGEFPEEWTEPYGFIPMVFVPHIDIGQTWGWSEIHANMSRIRETDDIASKISDHIRKNVDPPWLFNFPKPKKAADQVVPPPDTSTQRPQAGREEVQALYIPKDEAKGQPLISRMDYQGVLGHLSGLVSELEREYPELRYDNIRLEGAVSGQTLRIARQPAEAKVTKERVIYDAGLIRAQNMAIAIGGHRNYEGFQGFSLDSFGKGDLEHTIGPRAVFTLSEVDELEEEQIFWETATVAQGAGADLAGFLELHGWTPDRIDLIIAEEEEVVEEEEPETEEEEEEADDLIE